MTTKKNRKNRNTKKKNINHKDDILTNLKRFITSRKLKKAKEKAKTLSNNRLNMSGGLTTAQIDKQTADIKSRLKTARQKIIDADTDIERASSEIEEKQESLTALRKQNETATKKKTEADIKFNLEKKQLENDTKIENEMSRQELIATATDKWRDTQRDVTKEISDRNEEIRQLEVSIRDLENKRNISVEAKNKATRDQTDATKEEEKNIKEAAKANEAASVARAAQEREEAAREKRSDEEMADKQAAQKRAVTERKAAEERAVAEKKATEKANEEASTKKEIQKARNEAMKRAIIEDKDISTAANTSESEKRKAIAEEQTVKATQLEIEEAKDAALKLRQSAYASQPKNRDSFNDVNDVLTEFIRTKKLSREIVSIGKKKYKFDVNPIGKITQVTSDGSIAEAGLKIGDIILSFNVSNNKTPADVKRYVFNNENKKFFKEPMTVILIEYITKKSIDTAITQTPELQTELNEIISRRIDAFEYNPVILTPLLDPALTNRIARAEIDQQAKAMRDKRAQGALAREQAVTQSLLSVQKATEEKNATHEKKRLGEQNASASAMKTALTNVTTTEAAEAAAAATPAAEAVAAEAVAAEAVAAATPAAPAVKASDEAVDPNAAPAPPASAEAPASDEAVDPAIAEAPAEVPAYTAPAEAPLSRAAAGKRTKKESVNSATTLGTISPPLPKVQETALAIEKERLTTAYNTANDALTNYLIVNKLDIVKGKEVYLDDIKSPGKGILDRDEYKNSLGFDVDVNGIIIGAQPKGKIIEAGLNFKDLILSYRISSGSSDPAPSEHIFIDRDTIVKKSTNKYTTISYIKQPTLKNDLTKLIASRIKARKELDNLLTIDNDYVTAKGKLSGFIESTLTNKVANVSITSTDFGFDTNIDGSIANTGEGGSIAKAGLEINDIILTYKNDNDENINIYIGRDDFVKKAKQPPITIEYIKGTDLGNNKDELIELINARRAAKQAFDSYIDKLEKTPGTTPGATGTTGTTGTEAQVAPGQPPVPGQPISNDEEIENAIGAIILALALTISESMPSDKNRLGAKALARENISPETTAEYDKLTAQIATITKQRLENEKKFNEIKTAPGNKKNKKEGLIKILNDLLSYKQKFAVIKHSKYEEPSGVRPVDDKSSDVKPSEVKPSEVKPSEVKSSNVGKKKKAPGITSEELLSPFNMFRSPDLSIFSGGAGCDYGDRDPDPLCSLAVEFYNYRNREFENHRRTINEIMSYLLEEKINMKYQWVAITEEISTSSDYTARDISRTSRRVGIISKLNYDNTKEGTGIGPWGFKVWIPNRRGLEILVRPDANGLKKKLKVINDKEEIIDKFLTKNISLSYIEFLTDKQYDPTNDVNYKPVIIGEDPEETDSIGTLTGMRQGLNKGLNVIGSRSATDIAKGSYTTAEGLTTAVMTRGLREDLKELIKNIIETKFKEPHQLELLNTKIDFKNKKKLIKDILISKISYIFASGETRLNVFNKANLSKKFKEEDEGEENEEEGEGEGEGEDDKDKVKGKVKDKGADEEDKPKGEGDKPKYPIEGGGGYGFRNFDKDDAKNFIGFILASLTALQYDGIVETTKKLLFSNYLKVILKIKPGELNKLLLDIDNIQLLSTSVIKHYINKLTNNQGSSSETTDTNPSPAALISKLNFSLKSNVEAFMKSIVYITLHSEQMVGTKEKIETMWDNEYNKAMKLPVGEEQTRIEKFELNNAVKAILGSTNNSIKDYREKIKSIDSYIDSINEKNIQTKLSNFPSILSVAKLENGAIIYRLPDKIKSNLREQDAKKTEAAAVEASSKKKLQEAERLVRDLLATFTTQPTGTEDAQQAQQVQKTKLEKLLATLGPPPSSDQ